MLNILRVAVVELIGTFLLVYIPLSAAVQGYNVAVVALSFGITLLVLVGGLGPFSGGHFNPAVTLAAGLSKEIKWIAVPVYWVAQACGAVAASGIILWLLGLNDAKLGAALPNPTLVLQDAWLVVFIVEALGAFVLGLIILTTTNAKSSKAFAPFCIGGVLGLMVLISGSVTGGSFNPARYLGPAIFAGEWTMWGVYLTAPMVGTVLAGGAYQFLKTTTPPTP